MLIVQSISAIAGLGGLIFAIGFLLHALNRRGQSARIAELESILAERHKR